MRLDRTVALAVTLVIGASCSGAEPAEQTSITTPPAFPTAVVRDWLDAVSSGDLNAIAASVDAASATILIAVENGFSVAETAALLEGGIPEGVAASYWGTFEDAFGEFRGLALSALDVGDFRSIAVSGPEYAVVELSSPQGVSGIVTVRRQGRWTVDLVATFGPALVRRLRAGLDAALGDTAGDVVTAAYRSTVVPALGAAVELAPDDPLLRSELAAMEVLVGVSRR